VANGQPAGVVVIPPFRFSVITKTSFVLRTFSKAMAMAALRVGYLSGAARVGAGGSEGGAAV